MLLIHSKANCSEPKHLPLSVLHYLKNRGEMYLRGSSKVTVHIYNNIVL